MSEDQEGGGAKGFLKKIGVSFSNREAARSKNEVKLAPILPIGESTVRRYIDYYTAALTELVQKQHQTKGPDDLVDPAAYRAAAMAKIEVYGDVLMMLGQKDLAVNLRHTIIPIDSYFDSTINWDRPKEEKK